MPYIDTPHPAGCTCPDCTGGASTATDLARPDDRSGPDSLHGAASAGGPNSEDLNPEPDGPMRPRCAPLRPASADPPVAGGATPRRVLAPASPVHEPVRVVVSAAAGSRRQLRRFP